MRSTYIPLAVGLTTKAITLLSVERAIPLRRGRFSARWRRRGWGCCNDLGSVDAWGLTPLCRVVALPVIVVLRYLLPLLLSLASPESSPMTNAGRKLPRWYFYDRRLMKKGHTRPNSISTIQLVPCAFQVLLTCVLSSPPRSPHVIPSLAPCEYAFLP